MVLKTVHVTDRCRASADMAWAVVRDFTGAWHPAIASMRSERGANGGLIRCFTGKGEDTVYHEQLTYFSDSDREMAYRHLQGIGGVQNYQATLKITDVIDWQATFEADEPRATEIADGTKAIFEMGLATLGDATAVLRTLHIVASSSTKTIQIHGETILALTEAGAKSDTLCLFLHGIGGRRQNWDAQLSVAAEFMKAAALDLRGYGDSELGSSPSSVDDYCEDILRVMQHYDAKRLVLCGLSYGSWIAASFVMRHADKLAGLVLSGGCTGLSEASPQERENFRISRELPLNQGKTPADFAPDVLHVIAGPLASSVVRQELQAAMAAISVPTYRDALHCFTNSSERFDFSKLAFPVLMMTGEHDRLASPDEIRSVAKRIHSVVSMPNVRFEMIAGAGHVCNVEAPAAYNHILAEFLQGIIP